MKKARKGFTLVELLIVVAILGILSVSMMMSMGGSTAKAKAATIRGNFDAARAAVAIYYGINIDSKDAINKDCDNVLSASIRNWSNLKTTTNSIYYGASGTFGGKNLKITADYTKDPSSGDIDDALNGYGNGISASGGKASLDITPN